jgi:formylglycine-generating enzyme required for sulfatase activity/dienelactone hydrolase
MEGQTVSHYRIVERLGGGGMGVVYKAVDTRLDRPVALKFLPPELTRDDDARLRLIQEAKSASALDHPNICTVHDIDDTPEGQLFIAMAFYAGETLKKRIAKGPMTVVETIDVAIQVAQGLAKAHAAGIIHRDIKPANLMLTSDGVVKIVDFGIAKVVDQTGATRTGVTLGTVTYMSPEQLEGEPLDGRSDIWSLGATMYEMLTGKPPFDGDNALTVMKAIGTRDPVPVKTRRQDVPDALARIVARAMRRSRTDRQATATELVHQLSECRDELTGANAALTSPWRALTRPRAVAAAVVVALAVVAGAAWSFNRSANARSARERIGELTKLVEQDNYTAAFRVADEITPYLKDDPTLRDLWPRFSRTIAVTTKPGGARVMTKSYLDKADAWRELGVTPLENVRVPLGLQRWKFVRDGKPTVEVAFPVSPVAGPLNITLDDAGDGSEVAVTGGGVNSWITGIEPIERIQVPDFRISKYEVTNRQFKAFVQAGGYRKQEYWDQPFVDGAARLPFEKAMARFVDATGRPGPATWELGDYKAGQDEFPVTGVSWYEAAAYAKSVGKSLPTVRHWIRAAGTDFSAAIAPLSNLQGTGPAAVGSFAGMGPFGTYDMAGNVREWCWNAWGSSRYILGGAWSDPQYLFTYANLQSPFDRSATNGIRLASYPTGVPEDATKPVELLVRDYSKEKPVSDQVLDIYRRRFVYDPAPLAAKVEPATSATPDLRVEKVTFDAAYGGVKMQAYVYTPTSGAPPFQPVIFFPGSGAIAFPTPNVEPAAFLIKSGRMVVLPIYRGTFERRDGLTSTWPDSSRRYSEYAVNWVQDLERTIEYLETRRDVDLSKLSYYGVSWGGRWGAILPAIEPRFKAVVLVSAGLASGRAQPEVDQINYVTRVNQPVLMLNGRFDAIEPVETAQRPMFELLGTPKDRKKWVVFEDDHGLPAHRNELTREALAWLDRYVGPVQ